MSIALFGGKPIREHRLQYGKQSINNDDIEAVVDVMRSDYLTTGPKIAEFERALQAKLSVNNAIVVSNGTAALHAACFAAGIKENDEVITTPLTFAATANAILYCGGVPVFADIESGSWNLDFNKVEKLITSKTKALIVVDYAGEPVDYALARTICDKYGLILIADAAHAIGSAYDGKMVGTIADMTTFSFHPVKTITTGEGGCITTNSDVFKDRLLLFRTHGITRDEALLNNKQRHAYYYEQVELGYNYRMTDIQAALGLSQLKRIDSFSHKRRILVNYYDSEFDRIAGVFHQSRRNVDETTYHLYPIYIDEKQVGVDRDTFYEAMLAENIGVNLHYIPVYLHPYYAKLGYKQGLCPIAEEVCSRILTLPLYSDMTMADAKDVVMAVKKIIKYFIGER